ncbi:MAG: beta-ACP synthase, partial [Gemmatimonadaceae bacterium]|nr:beta-ACP synthase [Acetobacteraceae bacterium]
MGAISAVGASVPAMWAAMQAGRSGIGPIAGIPVTRLSARIAAEIPGFEPMAHFDARRAPMLDRAAQLAVVAGREAMAAAALPADAADPYRQGVVLAAAIGQTSLDAAYWSFYGEGASRVHPLTVPRLMPNAPASHLSMEFGLRGPCYAAASACASANHAIGLAADTIRACRAEVMLTGGADASIVVGVLKCWEGLRVLSPDTCRPFSRDRSGLVLGEGAAVLVLEEWEFAVARGAPILAELAGFGMTADGLDLTAPDADGAAAAMRAALADAGMSP